MASMNSVDPLLLATQSMVFKVFFLVILVLVVKLAWKTYFPVLKGRFGEKLVADTLAELPEGCRVVNDLARATYSWAKTGGKIG